MAEEFADTSDTQSNDSTVVCCAGDAEHTFKELSSKSNTVVGNTMSDCETLLAVLSPLTSTSCEADDEISVPLFLHLILSVILTIILTIKYHVYFPPNAKDVVHLNESVIKPELRGSKSLSQRSEIYCTVFIDSIICHFIVSNDFIFSNYVESL